MKTDNKTGAVILAAGRSEHIDGLAPLLSIGRTTMIQREIDTLRKAGISPIIVVAGYMAEELEKHVSHRGVLFVRNEAYENSEMLESVKIGLRALPADTDQVLLFPGDVPMVHAETVLRIAEAGKDAAVPVYQGKKGHPICISRKLFDAILSYKEGGGLRGVLAREGIRTEEIPVQDPGILIDTNTMSDYDAALALEESRRQGQKTQFKCDLVLRREEEAFCDMTASFLEAVEELGSMLSACERCGISYSKGWKMVRTAEEQFGIVFLAKRPGGAGGGSSSLTPGGKRFLEAYRAFERRVSGYAAEIFAEYERELSPAPEEKRH